MLWDNIVNAVNSIAGGVQTIVPPAAILVLIVCGILMMCGGELKQKASGYIRGVVIGCFIALAASSIVSWLASIFTFSTL